MKTDSNPPIPATSGEGCNVGTPAYVLVIGTYGGIMLSTVFAAEVQFRHDSEARARELAILGSIRDRRESLTAPHQARDTARLVATWPRPIGVKLDLTEATAAACA